MRDDGQIRTRAVMASYRFSALLVPIDVRLGTYLQSISPNRTNVGIQGTIFREDRIIE